MNNKFLLREDCKNINKTARKANMSMRFLRTLMTASCQLSGCFEDYCHVNTGDINASLNEFESTTKKKCQLHFASGSNNVMLGTYFISFHFIYCLKYIRKVYFK